MDHNQIHELHLRYGSDVARVVDQLFRRKAFSNDADDYVLHHYQELNAARLARWLEKRPGRWPYVRDVLFERLRASGNELNHDAVTLVRHLGNLEHVREFLRGTIHFARHSGLWWFLLRETSPSQLVRRITIDEATTSMPELAAALVDLDADAQVSRMIADLSRDMSDDRRVTLLSFLEKNGLRGEVATPLDVLPRKLRFGALREEFEESSREANASRRLVSRLALAWPGAGASAARSWYIQQIVQSAVAGTSWHQLVWRLPADGREEAALASLRSSAPSPYAGHHLLEALERGESHLWQSALDWARLYIDREEDDDLEEALRAKESARHLKSVGAHGVWADFDPVEARPSLTSARLVTSARLGPDDSLDDAVFELLSHLDAHHDLGDDSHAGVVLRRLLDAPRTVRRTERMLALACRHPGLFGEKGFDAFAREAGLISVDALPNFDLVHCRAPSRGDAVAAYRALGGEVAHQRIRNWLIAYIGEARSHAFTLAEELGLLEDREVREALSRAASRWDYVDLLRLRPRAPWLVTAEAILQRAIETAESGDGWGFQAPLEQIPSDHRAAVLLRARHALHGYERVRCLRWLAALEEPRKSLLACLTQHPPRDYNEAHALAGWVGAQLTTRSAWEKEGDAVLRALTTCGDFNVLHELLLASLPAGMAAASAAPDPKVTLSLLLEAMHGAFAELIASEIDAAWGRADEARVAKLIDALEVLSPPSRFVRRVRALRDKLQSRPKFVVMLDEFAKVVRERETDAWDDALFESVRLLAGAGGRDPRGSERSDGGDTGGAR